MYPSTSKEVAGYVFGLGGMANLPCGDRIDAPGLAETGTIASVVTRLDYLRTVFFAVLRCSVSFPDSVSTAVPNTGPGRSVGTSSGVPGCSRVDRSGA